MAAQYQASLLHVSLYSAMKMTAMTALRASSPPANPSSRSLETKSPNVVPSKLAKRIVTQ